MSKGKKRVRRKLCSYGKGLTSNWMHERKTYSLPQMDCTINSALPNCPWLFYDFKIHLLQVEQNCEILFSPMK